MCYADNQNKGGMPVLIADKIELKVENIRTKKYYFTVIKETLPGEKAARTL